MKADTLASPVQTDGSADDPAAKASDPLVTKYERLASRYDARWAYYLEATTRATVARLNLSESDRVLDVGCGTGVLLERLSAAFPRARLFGVDATPAMLAVARRKLASLIELREARAEALPFADRFFEVVVSCNIFHYLPNPLAALKEMSRVLRPGGLLVMTDWCADYPACRVYDWCLRLFSRAHVKTYRIRECLRLLNAAGQADAQFERYQINWFWGLMTIKTIKRPPDTKTKTQRKGNYYES